jgi:hypothetical protein
MMIDDLASEVEISPDFLSRALTKYVDYTSNVIFTLTMTQL